ncbi:hypothetical protein HYH03_016423 [Edaphochlamys debaryana]|uniref:BTB domain-containing protein n=1 Tax=Edaphochlamys debaryana TaxID=47281 RepID=A0A835XJV1_9CHLO|nr:hypothetical protein HYH03_016423 [Edaphochlamys debaryana]|eukprot:KAG2484769.1 hypothetical protein HYH03_016423 [Edaphochlamys debaryana]
MDRTDVPLPSPATGVVVRPCKDGGEAVLVLFNDGFRPLEGGALGRTFRLGDPLALRDAEGQPYTQGPGTWRAVYEPLSGCVFFREGHALMRLDADNVVTLAAGHKTEQGTADGEGGAARFHSCVPLAADGRGAIYLLDNNYTIIRKAAPSQEAPAPGAAPTSITAASVSGAASSAPATGGPAADGNSSAGAVDAEGGAAPASSKGTGEGGTCAAKPAASALTIATLPGVVTPSGGWVSLAYVPAYDSLLACTATAVYRIPLDAAAGHAPVLLAGLQGQCGKTDGFAPAARFSAIGGSAMGDAGVLHLVDGGALRTLDAWGEARTLVPSVTGWCASQPLACMARAGGKGGGGVASFGTAGGANASVLVLLLPKSGKRTFTAVGGEAFDAHRSVLCAGSEFFARMLEGGFAEGGAGPTEPVELREADPRAFQALLEYMYSGRLDVPDALLRPTCELAGRMLLPPELQGWLQGRLLGRATPGTAIDDLVWADRHGMSELAAQLKARIVRHRALVKAGGGEARAALERLAGHSTALIIELTWMLL